MTRLCERPGCSEPGAVSYALDAPLRRVTLAAVADVEHSRTAVLCRRHADSMVVPLGWTLDDRREPVPRLFKMPEHLGGATSTASTPGRRRSVRSTAGSSTDSTGSTSGDQTAPLPLFLPEPAEQPAPTVAELAGEHPDTGPDETRAMPWAPHFDASDDLDGLLSAETPLLARAFGNTRRRPRR